LSYTGIKESNVEEAGYSMSAVVFVFGFKECRLRNKSLMNMGRSTNKKQSTARSKQKFG